MVPNVGRSGRNWRREIPRAPTGNRTPDRPAHTLVPVRTALSRLLVNETLNSYVAYICRIYLYVIRLLRIATMFGQI
jgi:hypothetical protein